MQLFTFIEEFAPRFAQNSEYLYVGDTVEQDLAQNKDKLRKLEFTITLHNKMPDVFFYSEKKNWLYFIEFGNICWTDGTKMYQRD